MQALLLLTFGVATQVSVAKRVTHVDAVDLMTAEDSWLEADSDFEEELLTLGATMGELPMCEDIGLSLPKRLVDSLSRGLTDPEKNASFRTAGLEPGPGKTKHSEPVAVWVIGPSASGKSFVTNKLREQIDFPVLMDGDAFRGAHNGYQAAVWDGFFHEKPPCIWRSAWETVKPFRGKWRDELWNTAVEQRRNLIVVEVCTKVATCVMKMDYLKSRGYVNNVIGVAIKESISERRGRARASITGKRFGPTFALSMNAMAPVIQSANGWYRIVDNSNENHAVQAMRCERLGDCPTVELAKGSALNTTTYTAWTDESKQHLAIGIKDEIAKFVAGIEAHDTGAHLPYCEDLGVTMSDTAKAYAAQNYSDAELQQAMSMSQLPFAGPQKQPLALWVVGPAAVGKSTAVKATMLPQNVGLKLVHSKHGEMVWDAVTLDGEFYRDVHSGFKAIVKEGLTNSPPCIWKDGWSSTVAKKMSKVEKKRIFQEAVKARNNLIIPTSCASGFAECLRKVDVLKAAGYVNHLIFVTAKGSIIDSRGLSRADFKGKAYFSTMKVSNAAFTPMIAAIDGHWELLESTGVPWSVVGGKGGDGNLDCATAFAEANPYMRPDQALVNACGQRQADVIVGARKVFTKHNAEVDSESMVTNHLPFCDHFDIKIPQHLDDDLNREITPEEFAKADVEAGVNLATSQEKPIALWLMGSSAVGKSTASKALMEEYGIPKIKDGNGEVRANAVQIDGEIFRSAHNGFKNVVEYGLRQNPPCLFEKGWKGTRARSESKVYKKKVFSNAVQEKKNLIIPSPCASDLAGCLGRVQLLSEAGYVNHIVVIYAREKLVEERGLSRADRDGKKFVSVVEDSTFAFAPMIAIANGNYTFIDNTGMSKRAQSGKCLAMNVANTSILDFEQKITKLLRPMFDVSDGRMDVQAPSKYD